jgi:phosphoribosylanthranilate isomerase
MKLKICGITRPKDVQICEDLHSEFIGFINIKRSIRYLNLDKIRQLVEPMKDKKRAVLGLEPKNIDETIKTVEYSKISTIQLHSLQKDDIIKLKSQITLKKPVRIIKAIGIPERFNQIKKEEIKEYAGICDFLLFDSQVNGKSGGTGKHINVEHAIEAAKIAKNVNHDIKLFLAGGLNFEFIKKEINTLEQFYDYIDVNSGVEDQPGIKSHKKMRELIQYLKN